MTVLTRAASIVALSAFLASGALAAPAAPLPAGKPAGVKQAALETPALIWVGAAAVIAVTIAVVASDDDGDGPITTATGTAP